MNADFLVKIDEILKKDILEARDLRSTKYENIRQFIPEDLLFLADAKQYHIKEIMSICRGDYRELVVALLTKHNSTALQGYSFLNLFRTRPLLFVLLLSLHPQSKARVTGKIRFVAVKALMKNPKTFSFVRKIYLKVR